MNILFIEDEERLLSTGLAQLERLGHVVYPAVDIAGARAVLLDESKPVDLVIADHRLPDGAGIQFVIEIKETYPETKCAIVSGCLIPSDIEKLKAHDLLYFHKPLLYAKVVDGLRQHYAMRAPLRSASESESEGESQSNRSGGPKATEDAEPAVKPKKKVFSGFFGRRSKSSSESEKG